VIRSVLLVTQYYPPERGAAQVRLGAIVRELRRRDLDVEVLTALPNYPTGRIFPGWRQRLLQYRDEDGVRVGRVWVYAAMGSGPARMANYLSFGLTSVLGVLRAGPADWTVVEYPTLFGALPAVLLSRLRRRRVALLVADLWVDSIVEVGAAGDGALVSFLRRVERWMLRSADRVTAVTEGVRDALVAKGVRPDRLAWLPNGADTDLFSPGPEDPALRSRFGLRDDTDVVLYAGTHGYVHGLEVVLDAAEVLRGRPVEFLLVGSGSEKPGLVAEAATRGLTNVVFADPVDPETVAELLRIARISLATVREGDLYRTIRSAKMLPAMAAAVPVVYSADDEGSRIVRREGAGIVTPPGDGAALADAVASLLDDPDRAAAMGAAGRAWVESEASWRRLVGDWLAELDPAAAASPGASVARPVGSPGAGGRSS
jgi:colanic acid biosynthesis glycosyl transferase WcaI